MINGNFIGAEKKAVQVGSPHHCDDRSLPLRGIGHQYSPDRVVWQMDSVKLKGELKIPRTNIQHPEKIQDPTAFRTMPHPQHPQVTPCFA